MIRTGFSTRLQIAGKVPQEPRPQQPIPETYEECLDLVFWSLRLRLDIAQTTQIPTPCEDCKQIQPNRMICYTCTTTFNRAFKP